MSIELRIAIIIFLLLITEFVAKDMAIRITSIVYGRSYEDMKRIAGKRLITTKDIFLFIKNKSLKRGSTMEGKIVKITGTSSVFDEFLGAYGIIKEKAYGDKWTVELRGKTKNTGTLSHTVSEEDFEVVS